MLQASVSAGNRSPEDIAHSTPYRPVQNSVTKSRVEVYAQAMADGKKRDKIKIPNADDDQFILHGHHRVLAAELAGVEIPWSAIEFEELDGDWPLDPGWENVSW